MGELLTLTGGGMSISFDDAPFVLEEIDFGAAPPPSDCTTKRRLKLCGYIVSEGETEEARRAYLREKRALLCKAVMADGKFTVKRGGRQLSAIADAAPEFSADAVFSGSDADRFTVKAEAERMFTEPSSSAVFGGNVESGATEGTLTLSNSGDEPCGCIIEIGYTDGALNGMTLTLGGKTLTFVSSETGTASVTVDTRRGRKAVRTANGMRFDMIESHSGMPVVPCGESSLAWSAQTAGIKSVRVTFVPEFYAR